MFCLHGGESTVLVGSTEREDKARSHTYALAHAFQMHTSATGLCFNLENVPHYGSGFASELTRREG